MRRREFITLLGGTVAAWPLGASAQQPAMPVIGFVNSGNSSPGGTFTPLMTAFHQGLNEGGYVEGRNIAIEYHWAGGQYDRLPELLSDLLRRQVTLIVASGGLVSALHAKAATKTTPILFIAGFDPVKVGLVTSLSHPGGNATGVSMNTTEMAQKRLELLHKLLPKVATVAILVNPNSTGGLLPTIEIERVQGAARDLGLKLLVLEAGADREFEKAFASAIREGAGALSVNADPFFTPRRAQIVALAAHHGLPTIYPWREYAEAGGLMSYGPTLTWAYHQLGLYAGRILKGAKPGDLPVQLPTKFELVLNLKTVKALGLTVPRPVLAATNEFIE
jgi:putative ABC transport system substrate-binding protein